MIICCTYVLDISYLIVIIFFIPKISLFSLSHDISLWFVEVLHIPTHPLIVNFRGLKSISFHKNITYVIPLQLRCVRYRLPNSCFQIVETTVFHLAISRISFMLPQHSFSPPPPQPKKKTVGKVEICWF